MCGYCLVVSVAQESGPLVCVLCTVHSKGQGWRLLGGSAGAGLASYGGAWLQAARSSVPQPAGWRALAHWLWTRHGALSPGTSQHGVLQVLHSYTRSLCTRSHV